MTMHPMLNQRRIRSIQQSNLIKNCNILVSRFLASQPVVSRSASASPGALPETEGHGPARVTVLTGHQQVGDSQGKYRYISNENQNDEYAEQVGPELLGQAADRNIADT
jgi:hypothetical protein